MRSRRELYTGPLSMFGAKAQIALLEKGLAHDLIMVPFSLKSRYTPKHPEVERINPKKQVPVLVDRPAGSEVPLELYDSTLIFEYLEDRYPTPVSLWPSSVRARARARRLEHESDEVFFPQVVRLMVLQHDLDGEAATDARLRLVAIYRRFERALGDQDHLAADAFSFADIAFYMAQFFADALGARMPADCRALWAWRVRVAERPAVASVTRPMCSYLSDRGLRAPEGGRPHA